MAQQDQTVDQTPDADVHFPDVEVELGQDAGNGFLVISRVRSALRLARQPKEIVDAFTDEALHHDYSHIEATVKQWVTVK